MKVSNSKRLDYRKIPNTGFAPEDAAEAAGSRLYRVFKNDSSDYVAVKVGFSWPAFFFGPFWCLAEKMWMVALLYCLGTFAVAVFLIMIYPFLVVLAPIVSGIVLGKGANISREWELEGSEYKCIGKVRADSKSGAVEKIGNEGRGQI